MRAPATSSALVLRRAFCAEQRYLDGIRAAAEPWLFPVQQRTIQIVPAALGELSQAIGAGLTALFTAKKME